MQVTVKLFAFLREGRGKIMQLNMAEDSKIDDILHRLRIDRSELAIILVNGLDATSEQILQQDDVIALFPPAGGG